jgi:hypothetical protein
MQIHSFQTLATAILLTKLVPFLEQQRGKAPFLEFNMPMLSGFSLIIAGETLAFSLQLLLLMSWWELWVARS